MSKTVVNKSARISRDQKMIEGFKKHLSGVSLIVAGQTLTDVQVVALLQARIDAVNAVISSKADWQSVVMKEIAEMASTKLVEAGVRKAIMVMFGQSVDILSDFGLTPPKKRTPPTVAKKTATVKKAKATRVARNTMSTKKKLTIHGVVPPDTVTETQLPPKPPLPPQA